MRIVRIILSMAHNFVSCHLSKYVFFEKGDGKSFTYSVESALL